MIGKVAKRLKIFKNVQKLYRNVQKLYRNIQKLHRNVQKYSTFLDADCAAKFNRILPRLTPCFAEAASVFVRLRRDYAGQVTGQADFLLPQRRQDTNFLDADFAGCAENN